MNGDDHDKGILAFSMIAGRPMSAVYYDVEVDVLHTSAGQRNKRPGHNEEHKEAPRKLWTAYENVKVFDRKPGLDPRLRRQIFEPSGIGRAAAGN